jgi:hypothetical protein
VNAARAHGQVQPYAGQLISLATRHAKERALARPLRRGIGAELILAAGFDTDDLGTFCGERPRTGSAEEVCRTKAERGMDATGLALGMASEGSFGPHPLVPLLPVGEEWMTFVDRAHGLVITERLLARRTNFAHCVIPADADLSPWLERVGFPAHGLIVRPHSAKADASTAASTAATPKAVFRGIRDPQRLAHALRQACRASPDQRALVETDMRAHMNPTRMAVIRALAFRLVRRITTPCPACSAPGWGLVESWAGLPCSWCGAPTALIHREVFGCAGCAHREERPRRDGLTHADPGQCPHCNP